MISTIQRPPFLANRRLQPSSAAEDFSPGNHITTRSPSAPPPLHPLPTLSPLPFPPPRPQPLRHRVPAAAAGRQRAGGRRGGRGRQFHPLAQIGANPGRGTFTPE